MVEQRQPVDLSDVVEVKEFRISSADTNGVNAYLQAGWVMIAAYTEGIAERDGQDQVYALAWLRANGDPVHPEFKTEQQKWLEKRR